MRIPVGSDCEPISKRALTHCRGHERRFEREALVHLESIHRAAVRLTQNPFDAEDLTQEVFLRAHRFFHRFRPGTNCRAWLFKILKNTHIDQLGGSMPRRKTISVSDPETALDGRTKESLDFEGAGPEELLLNKSTGELIQRAFRRLPEAFQRIFFLSRVEGFSYREIAEIEGCPIGTVMSRLYRARRELQTLLGNSVQEAEGQINGESTAHDRPRARGTRP